MFYTGDLKSGISLAVTQNRVVGCFVYDDEETSKLWEEDFLTGDDLPELFGEKVVLLKLRQGSEEAGFLGQMCPLFHTPTFVMLGNGLLKLYITSNPEVSKEDFIKRVKAALQDEEPAPHISAAPPTQAPSSTTTSEPSSTHPLTQSSNPSPSPNQQLYAERAQKLEADKKAKEAAAATLAAGKKAKAKAEKEAFEAGRPVDPKKAAGIEYAKLRNERLKKEKDDLAKVRKRVEDDKVERKMREMKRKELERANAVGADEGQEPSAAPAVSKPSVKPTTTNPSNPSSRTCAIQIRLFDGSTIRHIFEASTSKLSTTVRDWIKSEYQEFADIPFSFKHVLTPLPNRTISISEEEESLAELGLIPSATLILVPVKNCTGAYDGGGGGLVGSGIGLVSGVVGGVVGVVGSGVGLVGSVLGGVLGAVGLGGGSQAQDHGSGAVAGGNGREERDRRESREFYNGNNLSFEPRRDEEEE